MTDVHCHISCHDSAVREFIVGRDFLGIHPWDYARWNGEERGRLESAVKSAPDLGVGEIGLDRLKCREIPSAMREAFSAQLEIAAAHLRPVVLHGAKCWGQVVAAVSPYKGKIPSFLFHGFSRSDGLIPDIAALNGFISVGPAILNDHAVNYRRLAAKIPLGHLLVETDRTEETLDVSIGDVLDKLAQLRGIAASDLERVTDENAERFFHP